VNDCSTLLSELDRILRESGAIAQNARSTDLGLRLKPGGSIVTNGDIAVEKFLRQALPPLASGSTVWGEEFGFEPEGEGGLWLVDPVDGTSNFAFGSPLWGITVALAKGDDIIAGAVYLPDIGEMYLASRGGGVTCDGQPLPPIPAGEIKPWELVSYCESVQRRADGQTLPGRMRCSGAFVIDGTFTLRQRYRGLIGVREKLYDIAACVLMGQELGADVRYADGRPFLIEPLKCDKTIADPWVMFPSGSGFHLGR
jgi:myo-inositol-1(or 4)-monophosphatase